MEEKLCCLDLYNACLEGWVTVIESYGEKMLKFSIHRGVERKKEEFDVYVTPRHSPYCIFCWKPLNKFYIDEQEVKRSFFKPLPQ
jgi:hypothetical protein